MSQTSASSVSHLIPQDTIAHTPGQGEPLELGARAGKSVLLVLRISDVVEQETLDVSIWGARDGDNWGEKPLFSFPQQFYRGVIPAALHLNLRPEIKFLQARWAVDRFGRGYVQPYFRFGLEVQDLD